VAAGLIRQSIIYAKLVIFLTIYAKFSESSYKKVFKKQTIVPWLTEHDDVINITSLPAPRGGVFCYSARRWTKSWVWNPRKRTPHVFCGGGV